MKFTAGNARVPSAPPPPSSNATWNPADKAATVSLSGANLIAGLASNGIASVRATLPKSSGKFYFEVTATTASATVFIGVANASATLANFIGISAAGFSYDSNPGGLNNGGAFGSSIPYVTGDIIRVAVDISAGLIWIGKVGSAWLGPGGWDPNTGSGGFSMASLGTPIMIAASLSTVAGSVVTLNSGGSAFAGTVPTGFTPGWPP